MKEPDPQPDTSGTTTYPPEKFDELTRTSQKPWLFRVKLIQSLSLSCSGNRLRPLCEEPAEVETDQLREQFKQALLDQGLEESVEITVTSNRIDLQIRERILFQLSDGRWAGAPGSAGTTTE
ncbi:hypothetical protein [Candidatus Vondammii sp. HM_W22]|uniref:hypothetical protein n=1 Tax=Candidatus Vondammii sp. HM_W22 TaxID=2687299 RepID=UPI001F145265|nr:hypothetical protein [Candidatus Vondammii sp. HM_W22]